MGRSVWIVTIKGVVVYLGDDGEKAKRLAKEVKDAELTRYDLNDHSQFDFSFKIKARKRLEDTQPKNEVPWHIQKRGGKR